MKHDLPIILGAGIFDSKTRFKGINITEMRKVNTYELEYFSDFKGIAVINGKENPIKKGTVLFAKPGDIRYSHLPFGCKFLHFNLTDKSLINAVESIPSFFSVSNPKTTEETLSNIIALVYSANQFDNITASAELITFLHKLSNEKIENPTVISLAKAFIEQNYKENISIDSVAAACNVSPAYLHKIFKNTLGITPGNYLLNIRISVAQNLLVNTHQPLIEIAFNCGFNSQSYFSSCFSKALGISPKDYRKNATYTL